MLNFITIITIQLFIIMIAYYHSIIKWNDKVCYFLSITINNQQVLYSPSK